MEVDDIKIKDLFEQDVQYKVPIFQREYVWTLEDQWEALWEDIQYTAEKYLERLDEVGQDAVEAERCTRRHFMGAVVLQKERGRITDTRKYLVIDGQQRLITMQLLLGAARDTVKEVVGEMKAEPFEHLVVNDRRKDIYRFKLWPADNDKNAFRYVMTEEAEEVYDGTSRIIEAYEYFCDQMRKWLEGSSDRDIAVKTHALETTLLGLFEVVAIELSPDDDPSRIFEVLNARGTPLSAADLIKNHMLHIAKSEDCAKELHDGIWKYFTDDSWWAETKKGASVRSQLNVFLNYWLSSAVAEEIKSHQVYPEFVKYVKKQQEQLAEFSILTVAREIHQSGQAYRSWHEYDSSSELSKFFHRIWRCGLGAMSPLVLWLFVQPDHVLPEDERLRIVRILESFLVRRALCRMMTAGLNRLNITLLQQIRKVEGDRIRDTLINTLTKGSGSSRWPDDDEVERAVLKQPLYGRVAKYKIRAILSALEDRRRSNDEYCQMPAPDVDQLTIEHIMPRSWQTHWQLPADVDHEIVEKKQIAEMKRNELVDTLGNLTLLTAKLNTRVSNASWQTKRDEMGKHPGLYLNQDVLQKEAWTDNAIRNRGRKLLDDILKVWPYPTTNAHKV